jgi:hypothetical protein
VPWVGTGRSFGSICCLRRRVGESVQVCDSCRRLINVGGSMRPSPRPASRSAGYSPSFAPCEGSARCAGWRGAPSAR